MPENEKKKLADAANMIVGGYAYERFGDNIRVINLNKKNPDVMVFTPEGVMIESNMDPIEEEIALQKWNENKEFMETRVFQQFCSKYKMSSLNANILFKECKIWRYIEECYDTLHLSGDEYVLNDITQILSAKGVSL